MDASNEIDTEQPERFPELARAKERLAANDGPGAEAILAELVKSRDAPLSAHMLYARVLLRRRKTGAAIAASRAIEKSFPDNWRASAQLGQMLLWLGRDSEAEEQLSGALARFPDEPGLLALCAEAKLMAGDPERALELIRTEGRKLEDQRLVALKVVSLEALGRKNQAGRVLRAASAPPPGLEQLYRSVVSVLERRGKNAEAVDLAASANERFPDSMEMRLLHAEALFRAARHDDTVLITQDISATPNITPEIELRFLKLRARALQGLQNSDEAVAVLESILAIDPGDEGTLRDLYVLHQKAGRADKMRAYGKQLSRSGASRMPETLAAGLAAIQTHEPRREYESEKQKLDWAWEIADKSLWTKDAWLERVRWGQRADRLLRAWWLNLPERAPEIDALMDRPSHSALDDMPPGARCLCAGTHMGPLAAAVRYLQTCGRPFRGFGFAGADPVVGDAPPMRIASRGGAGVRELLDEINKGTLIGFAAETPEQEKNLAFDFLGRKVLLPTFVPRLIHRHKTASLWWHALWRDGRIVIELERLPDPVGGEDIDAFCQRWATAYLAHIESVVRGAPENLNLGPGIWTNVTR